MDEKDVEIIEILSGHARTSFAEIARRTGLSESAVRNRVENLERAGIIRGYRAVIDPPALGYRSVTYLGLDTEPEHFLDIVQALAAMEEVRWVATATGDHMVMAEVWTADDGALARFLDERVRTLPGVRRVCPTIIRERMG